MIIDNEYKFKLNAYTPATIPMKRLAKYLKNLADMMEHEEAVHFTRLEKGSTEMLCRIDPDKSQAVYQHLAMVNKGEASAQSVKAYNALNGLLFEDNTSATFTRADGAHILNFLGTNIEGIYKSVIEHGSLDGEIIRVGGSKKQVPVQLQCGDIIYSQCYTDKQQAKALASKLFEPIRLFGEGKWCRTPEGIWKLNHFKIQAFEALEQTSLSDVFHDLRGLPYDEENGDIFTRLEQIRYGDDAK